MVNEESEFDSDIYIYDLSYQLNKTLSQTTSGKINDATEPNSTLVTSQDFSPKTSLTGILL